MTNFDLDAYIKTAIELLKEQDQIEAAELLGTNQFTFEEITWPTDVYFNESPPPLYELAIYSPVPMYARIKDRKREIETEIKESLQSVFTSKLDIALEINIYPSASHKNYSEFNDLNISKSIRRNIIDGLLLENIAWSGRENEVSFLERIFDLEKLPSYDLRYSSATDDIYQHRINNPNDWDDDWIFSDARFNLTGVHHTIFLNFLCATVHPVVRPNSTESQKLVKHYNQQLHQCGWTIIEAEYISGRPRYTYERLNDTKRLFTNIALKSSESLNADWIRTQTSRIEAAWDTDPALAIGTAKEMVETCSKTILKELGVEFSKSANLPALTKLLCKELGLVSEGISDQSKGAEIIRVLLKNLASLTQSLAELRSLYGSGHGPDGKMKGLQPRHARLACGTAITFVDFIVSTYKARKTEQGTD